MSEVNIDRPSDRLAIEYKGEAKTIFMSYARLNNCLRMLGDPNRLMAITLDPDLSEDMLKAVLCPTIEVGEVLNFVIGEDDVTMETAETILGWVQDQLSYFFMKRFQLLTEKNKQLEPLAARLQSSLNGLGTSSSNEPSAGPST